MASDRTEFSKRLDRMDEELSEDRLFQLADEVAASEKDELTNGRQTIGSRLSAVFNTDEQEGWP